MAKQASKDSGIDLRALDGVLESITALTAQPATRRSDFYRAIHRKIVASTDSQASSTWVANPAGQVRMIGHHGLEQLTEPQRLAVEQFARLRIMGKSVSKQSQLGFTFSSASCEALNGLNFLYLLVRPASDTPLAQEVFGDLASELARLIEAFENAKTSVARRRSASDLLRIVQLVQNLGRSKDWTQLTYHLVNDLAKLTGADRVSFISPRRKIWAISGAADFSLRTSTAKTLARIAGAAVATRGGMEWSAGQLASDGMRLPRGLKERVAELPSQNGFVLPIFEKRRRAGVLVLEFFETGGEVNDQETSVLERRELINEAVAFASPVILRSHQVHSIPGIGKLDLLFNRILARPVRTAFVSLMAVAVAVAMFYALFCVFQPLEIHGEGLLLPTQQQHVFAQLDGEVDRLHVGEGDSVRANQVLLNISDLKLDEELISIEGSIGETRQELRNLSLADFESDDEDSLADETHKASEIERLNIRLSTLETRLTFFESRKSRLHVTSPIDGQITTPGLRQRLLARPVNRGDLLMTVAKTQGPWQLELKIPENRVEFVDAAFKRLKADAPDRRLTVQFRLSSDSQQTHQGTLRSIDYRSELSAGQEELSMVVAMIDIDEQELSDSLRLGARVYGKIDCGQRSNFYLLTYELRQKLYEWLFF